MLVPKGRRCVGVGIPWVTAEAVSSRPRPAAAGGAVPLRKRPTAVGSAVRLKSAVAACLSPRGAAASAFGSLGLSWKCFLLHLRPAMAGGAVPLRKRPTAVGSAVWWKSAVAACLFPRGAAASVLGSLGLPPRRFRRARDLLRQVALCHCARDLLRWVAPCGGSPLWRQACSKGTPLRRCWDPLGYRRGGFVAPETCCGRWRCAIAQETNCSG
ncbi:hypothetical protein Vafri_1171 [Volvox africanus]|nr:hypothetical protein Vafri_1171 [Volvox africanus]